MKREILFRGKRTDNGEWVEGDLIHGVSVKKGKMYILPIVSNLAYLKGCDPLDGYEVTPETVIQFTGITDKNGIKVFEGYIVSISYPRAFFEKQIPSTIGVVRYLDCLPRFMIMGGVEPNCVAISSFCNTGEEWEVIGNIYDNLELLNQ